MSSFMITENIIEWLNKRKLMYSLDNEDDSKTVFHIQIRKRTEFKVYNLIIYNELREFELLDVSKKDTSFQSQFLMRTRFSFYKDVLKKFENEIKI